MDLPPIESIINFKVQGTRCLVLDLLSLSLCGAGVMVNKYIDRYIFYTPPNVIYKITFKTSKNYNDVNHTKF